MQNMKEKLRIRNKSQKRKNRIKIIKERKKEEKKDKKKKEEEK